MRAIAIGAAAALLVGCGGTPIAPAAGRTAPGEAVEARSAGFGTARDGYWRAESDARKWDGASRLYNIEGTAIENGYMMGDWGYTFFSPFKREEGLLVVWDGFKTQSFKIRKDPLARPMFSATFNVDSREAILICEKNGLASRRVYRIELSEDNPQMRLQWTIQAQEGEYVVDASTGQLLKSPKP